MLRLTLNILCDSQFYIIRKTSQQIAWLVHCTHRQCCTKYTACIVEYFITEVKVFLKAHSQVKVKSNRVFRVLLK